MTKRTCILGTQEAGGSSLNRLYTESRKKREYVLYEGEGQAFRVKERFDNLERDGLGRCSGTFGYTDKRGWVTAKSIR